MSTESKTATSGPAFLGGIVRLRPLDNEENEQEASAVSVHGGRKISVSNASRSSDFEFATHIAGPSTCNTKLFEELMPSRIAAFWAGYNVNFLAYGQTGAGKTHTMFGPPGIMAKAGKGDFGTDVCEDYGLFPRSVVQIYRRLNELNGRTQHGAQRSGGGGNGGGGGGGSSAVTGDGCTEPSDATGSSKRYVLSCGAVEMSVAGHEDMFQRPLKSKSSKIDFSGSAHGVFIDDAPTPPCVRGHQEQIIDSDEALLRIFEVMSSRNTQSTKLNDSSSRSHCISWLHLYEFDESSRLVTKTRFQFCDLAGSERIKDAHGVTNFADAGVDGWQGMMTNFGLMMLSQAVRAKVRLQKTKKKFSHRTATFASSLVPLLYGSISGDDLTALVVCCSQKLDNASQTINALQFGATFSRLHVVPRKVKAKQLDKLVKEAEHVISTNTIALSKKRAGGKDNRYTKLRQARLRDAEFELCVFQRFSQ